eukprot:5510352-Amphidinium_carterae.1
MLVFLAFVFEQRWSVGLRVLTVQQLVQYIDLIKLPHYRVQLKFTATGVCLVWPKPLVAWIASLQHWM